MTPDEFYEARNKAHFQKLLDHYIWIAGFDKSYAWARVKELAASTEFTHKQYEQLPERLKEEMLARKSNAQQIEGSTHE